MHPANVAFRAVIVAGGIAYTAASLQPEFAGRFGDGFSHLGAVTGRCDRPRDACYGSDASEPRGQGGTPYNGTPVSLPGTVQAENFDIGGNGTVYFDRSPGNNGGQYRSTDVDIEGSSDSGGGYNVGWMSSGEWLKYTVTVSTAGTYTLEFRVAASGAGGTFHLEVNGSDKTGPLTIPNTGGWQSWATVTKTGVSLAAGQQAWRVVIDSAGPTGVVGNFNLLRVVAAGGGSGGTNSAPYGGTPVNLPGTIQAENFDEGGATVAYADTTAGNAGGQYRSTNVDIETTADAGGGYNLGWTAPGEWLKYTVNVTTAGTYTLEFRVAARAPGGTFHLEVNGVDKTGPLTIPNTGSYQTWTTISKSGVSLAGGEQVWRLVIDTAGTVVGNFNYIRVTGSSGGGSGPTPFSGTPVALPGTVQLENFDNGGAGVAYVDQSSGNSGGQYRSTDVDIEASADTGGGFNLGWVSAGEWLNYSVTVPAAGTYRVEVRVASPAAGGTFHLEVNGVNKTGPLSVPNTGGWQSWQTVLKTGVSLSAGPQIIRVVMDTNGSSTNAVGNFNWLRVTSAAGGTITLIRAPYLQQVTDTSAVVVWTTPQAGAGAVRYSPAGGAALTSSAATRFFSAAHTGLAVGFYQHEARLSDLAPDSVYTYDVLVGGQDATAGQDTLRTAPSSGTGSVRFIAFADSGRGSAEQMQLAALMAVDSFDLAIHAGDVAYGDASGFGGGSYPQYDEWLFDVYGSWMRSRPFYPSIGNHDDEIESARPYRDVFVLPENGASPMYPDHAERYYSFDHGPVHFVALDTESAFEDPAARQAQVAWLEADLASTSQPWRVVYFHRSPYSAGGHGSDLDVRKVFAPVFERYDVQLVISAHSHVYERSIPWREYVPGAAGVTYIVSGGGGATLYPSASGPWTATSASVHHYVRVSANTCTLTGEAVRLTGTVFDTFELQRCGTNGAGEEPERSDSSLSWEFRR